MKTFNFLSVLFFSIILFSSCADDDILIPDHNCNAVVIHIENASGYDILDFTIDDTTWDNLKNGDSIVNICQDELVLDASIPLIYYTGVVDGEDKKSIAFLHWCGVGLSVVDEGTFKIKIQEIEDWNPEILPYTNVEE